MQYKGLDRKITFNYKKFKNTFLILLLLFLVFGCGNLIDGNTYLTAFGDESNDSTPLTDFSYGNRSDSGSSVLDGSVKLSWVAPNTNADGTKLTDLSGYIVYYGEKTDTDNTYSIDVGNSTFIKINDLSFGTWCFAVTSYDIDGNESDYSFEVCKDI